MNKDYEAFYSLPPAFRLRPAHLCQFAAAHHAHAHAHTRGNDGIAAEGYAYTDADQADAGAPGALRLLAAVGEHAILMDTSSDEFVGHLFDYITTELGIVGWRWEWSNAGGHCWIENKLIQLHPYPVGNYDKGEEVNVGYAQQIIHEIAHIYVATHCSEFWDKAEELAFRFLGTGLNEWQIEAAKIYSSAWKPNSDLGADAAAV